jgi:hypothetical protein
MMQSDRQLPGNHLEAPKKLQSYLLFSLLAVALGAIIFARIRLLSVPLERDEGEFAYIGQLILKGIPPFAHAYTMKTPGVAILYALFLLLFGQTATAIHIGLLLINLACILMVFLLARPLVKLEGAMAAATSFAVLSVSQSMLGIFAHATHFIILFALAGFILLRLHTEKPGSRFLVLTCGLSFGCAFLMKQHAVFFFLFAAVYLIYRASCTPRRGLKETTGNLTLLFLGMMIPYALITVWMIEAGTFSQFWFWTVTYARDYASGTPLSQGLATLFFQSVNIMIRQLPLWLIGAIGGLFVVTRNRYFTGDRFFIAGFFIASFLTICPGLYFREHYYILLLPAVALLTGAALQSACSMPYFNQPTWKRSLPAVILIVAVGFALFAERSFLFSLTPLQASRDTYGSNPFPEAIEIARYLKEHSSPSDRIAVIGSEPEIYFYADRLSATGYLYMYGLTEKHANAVRMQREMIREIERAKPLFVVLVNVRASWLVRTSAIDAVLDWCEQYVDKGYDQVGIADIGIDETHYEWGSGAKTYRPASDSFITIFKKKS